MMKAAQQLTAEQVFKLVSPCIMVVKSFNSKGEATVVGSGVVVAPDRVITNFHVVAYGISFQVEHHGRSWAAKVVRLDPVHDLAELLVEGLTAPAARLRSFPSLAIGETVYAIGAPEGLELSISEGLISGLRDDLSSRVIQTTAPISQGSSGGGLFDGEGHLVGITTYYIEGGQNLNFAVPAEYVVALNQPGKYRAGTPAGGRESAAFDDFARKLSDIERQEAALQRSLAASGAEKAGRYDAAAQAYNEVVQLEPHDESAWVMLGLAYAHLGEYEKAITAERAAGRLKPEDETVFASLCAFDWKLRQFNAAIGDCQSAIRLKPDDVRMWYVMGLAYKALHEHSKLTEVYEKLKVLDPKRADNLLRQPVTP